MSPTIAKELDNLKEGDRHACSLCNPRPKRVPVDRVWAWSLAHPGESPWRSPRPTDSCKETEDSAT